MYKIMLSAAILVTAAFLSGCGGGNAVLTPGASGGGTGALPLPTSSAAATAASGIFAGAVATSSGTPSPAVALATPSSGSYTVAGLASQLDASRPPAAGTPVGTVGVVLSVGATSISVQQLPMIPERAADGSAISYVQNVALVGSFAEPLDVAIEPNTVFAGLAGLTSIKKGAVILAGGAVSGSTLQARLIAPLGSASPQGLQTAAVSLEPARLRPESSLGRDVKGAFARRVLNLAPALKSSGPAITIPGQLVTCYAPGGKALGSGALEAAINSQFIRSLGELDANFPFAISYAPTPALFTVKNGTLGGPGPVPDWLNFVPGAGTTAAPTLDLTAGLTIGASVTVVNTCPGSNPPITLASATFGYGIESSTTKPMPGPKQSVTLDAKACIGLNTPKNINLFVDPTKNFLPGFNPFGKYSTASLSFCDQPTLTGNFVTSTVGGITGATLNNGNATFDPSKSGPASVFGFGTFFPTNPEISFALRGLTYRPDYADGYKVTFSLLGNAVPITGTLAPRHVDFAGLTTADVPVTVDASNLQFCENVSSGNAFLGQGSACANSGAVTFEFCRPGTGPNEQCPPDASGTSGTVSVSEGGYEGTFRVVDTVGGAGALGGGCASGVATTYPVTVSPLASTGPTASFAISIGQQQLKNDDNGCNIYIVDDHNQVNTITLEFIGPANS